MKTLVKEIKVTVLIAAIAVGLLGSTQQCRAAYFPNYYYSYQTYLGYYNSTGNRQYLRWAVGFLYYYYAGYYGDYYGYNSDNYGYKSTNFNGSNTYCLANYNYYAYLGDYYARYY